jgi:phospholipase/carboxylesterase
MDAGWILNRRRFIRIGVLAAAAVPLGCGSPSGPEPAAGKGRLSARWRLPTTALEPGKHALGLGPVRDGYLRIPETSQSDVPAPMALLLHGAVRDAEEWTGGFPVFDELGLIVLGVDSRGSSWDLTYGGFGPDVEFIDAALAYTFSHCNVDPDRVAISGFSDGASYALSLGLTNGDLFTRVMAFSPGFMTTDGRMGKPPVFLSHGAQDPVLPVSFTRNLAADLRKDGYETTYEEFEGGHMLPYPVGEHGYGWFVNGA